MQGIDVSYANTEFDWKNAVDNGGAEFCIIRIGRRRSDGEIEIDDLFTEHINNAIAAGLEVGVYFYTLAKSEAEAVEEAQWVDATLKEYCQGTIMKKGIWFDCEDERTTGKLDSQSITNICSKFIVTMNELGYTNAGIYSGYKWFVAEEKILYDQLADYVPLWVAQYNSQCDFQDPRVQIWQYTDKFLGNELDANVTVDFK